MNFNTGNKDLDTWLTFFNQRPISNTKFLNLLKKTDKTFLTSSPEQDLDSELMEYLPLNGLLETDFKEVAFNKKSSEEAKARIAISILHHVNFENWKNIYSEIFEEVIQNCIIEGNYETLGIDFSEIISLAVKKELIDKPSFVETSIMRGITLGDRYPDNKSEKKLELIALKNKLKIQLGL